MSSPVLSDGYSALADERVVQRAIRQVAYAYEHVPFWRDHLDDAGIDPAELKALEDFKRIPMSKKRDYRANFPSRILANGVDLSDPYLQRSQSSGTGGDRLVTFTPRHVLTERMEATTSVHPPFQAALSAVVDQRVCRYAAPNCSDVECATPNTTKQDRILADNTLVLPVYHDLMSTPDSLVDRAIGEILEHRPQWLYVDPTHLAFLLKALPRWPGIDFGVEAIALTYTRATQVARRQIRDVFSGVPTAEVVSMSELGWVAMECPSGNLHLNTEEFFMELLLDGRPAEPGELAELVCTGFGDDVCPHLRYRTGDFYVWSAEPCSCGSDFPVVTFEGRATDMLQRATGEVALTARQVDHIVGAADWLDVFQIRQNHRDRVDFAFVPSAKYAAGDESEVHDRLVEFLGAGVKVRTAVADYLPGEASGKFAVCKSALAAPSSEMIAAWSAR